MCSDKSNDNQLNPGYECPLSVKWVIQLDRIMGNRRSANGRGYVKRIISLLRGSVADEAIQLNQCFIDCFAALAMTNLEFSHRLDQKKPLKYQSPSAQCPSDHA